MDLVALADVVKKHEAIHDSIQSELEIVVNCRYLHETNIDMEEAFLGLEFDE